MTRADIGRALAVAEAKIQEVRVALYAQLEPPAAEPCAVCKGKGWVWPSTRGLDPIPCPTCWQSKGGDPPDALRARSDRTSVADSSICAPVASPVPVAPREWDQNPGSAKAAPSALPAASEPGREDARDAPEPWSQAFHDWYRTHLGFDRAGAWSAFAAGWHAAPQSERQTHYYTDRRCVRHVPGCSCHGYYGRRPDDPGPAVPAQAERERASEESTHAESTPREAET